MTKSDKKNLINGLLSQVIKENEEEKVSELLSEVIIQVYQSGYTLDKLPFVSSTLNMFVKDFFTHFDQRMQGLQTNDKFLAMSAQGIFSLIDISLLPEE